MLNIPSEIPGKRSSPTFLLSLASLLSRPKAPFPHLVQLYIGLGGVYSYLSDCTNACTMLARALAAKERYPAFGRVEVHVEEPRLVLLEMGIAREPTPEEKVGALLEVFNGFERAGFEVHAEVRKTTMMVM